MYPVEELKLLAAEKAALRQRILVRRMQCAGAAARVARPLEWLDRALAQWRSLSPLATFAAVPLGLLLRRRPGRRIRMLGAMLRWGPIVLGAVRSLTAAQNPSHRI
jgi:hypothetical protein